MTQTESPPPAPVAPRGLRRVVIVNSALALLALGGFAAPGSAGVLSPLAAVVWVCIGPGLLVRARWTWRAGRVLIYAYCLGLGVLVAFGLLRGALLADPVAVLLELLIVIYLIGVRGYLNSAPARAYYGVGVHG